MTTDDLEQLVMRKMGGNPDVNGMGYADDIATVRDIIALVRAAVADEIRALRIKLEDQYSEGYDDAIRAAARIADPSRKEPA